MYKLNINDQFLAIVDSRFIDEYRRIGEISFELSYVSDFIHTKAIRDFISSLAHQINLEAFIIPRIILIVDEMNNNAIEHGSSEGAINKCRLYLKKEDNDTVMWCIEVEDNGTGPHAKTALEMETLRAHKLKRGYDNHTSIRGRGLFMIIVNIVDRVYFRDVSEGKGLIVGVKKRCKLMI